MRQTAMKYVPTLVDRKQLVDGIVVQVWDNLRKKEYRDLPPSMRAVLRSLCRAQVQAVARQIVNRLKLDLGV